jgi:hypothetical protein
MIDMGFNVSEPNTRDTHTTIVVRELVQQR